MNTIFRNNFTEIALDFIAVILVITFYSATKAFVAYNLGDKSYNIKNRLTLNPIKAIEPVGLILMYYSGFGWCKPINLSFLNIRDRKKAVAFFTVIPNVAIIVIATIFLLILRFSGFENSLLIYFVFKYTLISFCYVLINVLPVYPFDGYTLLTTIGNPDLKMFLTNYEKVMQMVFVLALCFGFFQLTFLKVALNLTNILFDLVI